MISQPYNTSGGSLLNGMELSETLAGPSNWLREGLMVSCLILLTFVTYLNTLNVPFVFDDKPNILLNPHVRLTQLGLKSLTEAGFESLLSNRPVAYISFALNYYWGQYNVTGYHWINILVHVTTGVLVYFLVRTTLNLRLLRTGCISHQWIAFFTALIWLVHPLQTQSVTYIVQRMNSMAAMFYILCLILYSRARLVENKCSSWALFAGAITAGMLALGSKENAATLPFFVFLYEWYFFQNLNRTWLKRNALIFSGLLILLAFLGYLYLGGHPLERIMSLYVKRDFTLIQRVLTEFRVVIFYISLLFFPHPSRLNLEHDFALSNSFIDPATTLVSFVIIAGLAGLACYSARDERLFSFAIIWFLGNLAIESSVIGLEIIFEHRNYLPSIFLSLLFVTLVARSIKWTPAGVLILCMTAVMCGLWTHERNSIWQDETSLWKDCVIKSPNKARPHNNLGKTLGERGLAEAAIHHYTEALRIDPDYTEAYYNLGRELAEEGRTEEAIRQYKAALRTNPRYAPAHNNLGIELAALGKFEDAIKHYSKALRKRSNLTEAHINWGKALAALGKFDEADKHYAAALKRKPDDATTWRNVGNALLNQGRTADAIKHYATALKLNPDSEETHNNLGAAFFRAGKIDAALVCFREAVRLNPEYRDAQRNLEQVSAIQMANGLKR